MRRTVLGLPLGRRGNSALSSLTPNICSSNLWRRLAKHLAHIVAIELDRVPAKFLEGQCT